MSTRLKQKQEKVQQILARLAEESTKGTLIIVEGNKDVKALRSLDIAGPILTAKARGKSFSEVVLEVEQAGTKEVILMLDFDRRGREAMARLTAELEHVRIRANRSIWAELAGMVSREVQCVEGLASYMHTLEHKTACL